MSIALVALGIKFFEEAWYVIIHMTFVVSTVLMGVLDKLSFSSHRAH